MDALERFRKIGQGLIKGFASVGKTVRSQVSRPVNTPINQRVLMRNLIDQTPYSKIGMDTVRETPVNVRYMPKANFGGLYAGEVTLNTSNLNPNNAVSILRHELGHAADVNAQGYNFTPATAQRDMFLTGGYPNSYGIMRNIMKVNPEAAKRLEGRLADWGQYYNQPYSSPNQYSGAGNWKDVEAYATMAETPNKIISPQIQQRFRQYIPMSKNINYSPVYPSPELLQTLR